MTWVRVRGVWLAVSLVVAVGLQDSTSAERVERERGRGVEQSSRKRWREEISSIQFSGTPYGECGALHASAHTHSAEEKRRRGRHAPCHRDFGPPGILVRQDQNPQNVA